MSKATSGRAYLGHSSGDTVQHSREGVAAGQWAAPRLVSQSGSRDVGVGAPLAFSCLFRLGCQPWSGAALVRVGLHLS